MSSMYTRQARVTAVISGKGGVGKTNVSVNLGAALAAAGRRTLIVDCDSGLANANVLLGLDAPWSIADVLARTCGIEEALYRGPCGLGLLAGHSGTGIGAKLGKAERERLALELRPYASEYDHVLVDLGSGIGADTLALAEMSDQLLVVLTPEPTSFLDAYALVKAMAQNHGCRRFSIVTNMVENAESGRELFEHFEAVLRRFVPVELSHLGAIPEDKHVRQAVMRKKCAVHAFPSAKASAAFRSLARELTRRPVALGIGGHRFFGMEQVDGSR